MKKRDLIIENEILRKENEFFRKNIELLQWDQDKLKFRLENLMRKWEEADET